MSKWMCDRIEEPDCHCENKNNSRSSRLEHHPTFPTSTSLWVNISKPSNTSNTSNTANPLNMWHAAHTAKKIKYAEISQIRESRHSVCQYGQSRDMHVPDVSAHLPVGFWPSVHFSASMTACAARNLEAVVTTTTSRDVVAFERNKQIHFALLILLK